MGCKTSKEAHVAELQVDDDHVRRRRAQAKHCDLGEHPPPLKLVRRSFVADDAASASKTPAVTPQAEAGRCPEPRRTSDVAEARRAAHGGRAEGQQPEKVSPGVPSSCKQRASPGPRVSTEASCEDIVDGGRDRNCRRRKSENEIEAPEGHRRRAHTGRWWTIFHKPPFVTGMTRCKHAHTPVLPYVGRIARLCKFPALPRRFWVTFASTGIVSFPLLCW